MNRKDIYKRLLKNKDIEYAYLDLLSIEKFKSYCGFTYPDIKKVVATPDYIFFTVSSEIDNRSLTSGIVFNLDGTVKNLPKQYINYVRN